MLDVFVVAIMVFAVDGRIFTTADLSLGIVLFAAAVLLSSLCLQRLARISHPRVIVDTSGLSPEATELANLLAERIARLPPDAISRMLAEVKGKKG